MIFIAIIAYGVVSRSLVLHKEIPFDVLSLLRQIFDPSYWVIFADIRDKDMIESNEIIFEKDYFAFLLLLLNIFKN